LPASSGHMLTAKRRAIPCEGPATRSEGPRITGRGLGVHWRGRDARIVRRLITRLRWKPKARVGQRVTRQRRRSRWGQTFGFRNLDRVLT
jgi:hypothetical protein